METRTPTLADGSQIDIEGPEFALRLSNLLREHRRATGERCSSLARRSGGRYRASELRAIERGRQPAGDPVELAEIYGADLIAILPLRTPIEIDPAGVVRTAGASEAFRPGDEEDMLAAYLRLVRRLRRAERDAVVQLRQRDLEILAEILHAPHDTVHERLSSLMAATRTSRRIAVMAVTGGVVVIGLGSMAVAAGGSERVSTTPSAPVAPTGPSAGLTEVVELPDVAVLAPVVPQVVRLPEGSWTAPVPPSLTLDVSPLAESILPEPSGDDAVGEESFGPAPTSDEPTVVGSAPPPAPAPNPPLAEPAPPSAAPAAPAPAPAEAPADPEPGIGVGIDDDGDEFGVGAPPVPADDPPLVEPGEPAPVATGD